ARLARALETAAAPQVHRCRSATAARGERLSRRAHPDPRKGIDGSRVLTKAQLTDNPDAAPVFDMVRWIPRIADGIRCHCGCADDPAFRSLLSCYEGDGMAQHCEICQGQGRLAFRLAKRGKSLAQIRAAIDEEFG
ncbi:MAG TPA: hypothetical protein VFJ74_10775, partial [Gemmatimonadaceae bacterium]|nr:hypothetical protein [Gemmatimonadaceae bacterium]